MTKKLHSTSRGTCEAKMGMFKCFKKNLRGRAVAVSLRGPDPRIGPRPKLGEVAATKVLLRELTVGAAEMMGMTSQEKRKAAGPRFP